MLNLYGEYAKDSARWLLHERYTHFKKEIVRLEAHLQDTLMGINCAEQNAALYEKALAELAQTAKA